MDMLMGLRLLPLDWRRAATALVSGLATVTALVVFLDATVFRSLLPSYYVAFFSGQELGLRIALMAQRAVAEEFIYRLGLTTLLVAIIGLMRPPAQWRAPLILAAILAAQAINVIPRVQTPANAAEFTYDILRYMVPGAIWGCLYWRHGFLTALVAHPATHLVLQPLLLLTL